MKRNKIYLIDSENINIQGIEEILALDEKQRKVFIFYTRNIPGVRWNDMAMILKYASQIQPVECFTGQNALDFQLVSFMGALIGKASKSEYIIVSNDKGYDACVSFWADRGILIHRLARENHKIQDPLRNQKRKQNFIMRLKEILSDKNDSFDLNRIADVFMEHNPSRKDIAPALFQSIGNKKTTLFLRAVGKDNLKILYGL